MQKEYEKYVRPRAGDKTWLRGIRKIRRPDWVQDDFVRANVAQFGEHYQREMLMGDDCTLVRIALARYGSRDICRRLLEDEESSVVNAARYFMDRKSLDADLLAS